MMKKKKQIRDDVISNSALYTHNKKNFNRRN
jgi:hypothetical protein